MTFYRSQVKGLQEREVDRLFAARDRRFQDVASKFDENILKKFKAKPKKQEETQETKQSSPPTAPLGPPEPAKGPPDFQDESRLRPDSRKGSIENIFKKLKDIKGDFIQVERKLRSAVEAMKEKENGHIDSSYKTNYSLDLQNSSMPPRSKSPRESIQRPEDIITQAFSQFTPMEDIENKIEEVNKELESQVVRRHQELDCVNVPILRISSPTKFLYAPSSPISRMSAVIPAEECKDDYNIQHNISTSYASHTLPKALSPHSQRKKLLQSPLANTLHQISPPVSNTFNTFRSSSPFVTQSECVSTTFESPPASQSYIQVAKQDLFTSRSSASTTFTTERSVHDSKADMSQLDHIKLYVQNSRPSLSSPLPIRSSLNDPLLRSPLSSPVPWNSETQSKTPNPILSEIKSNLTGRHTPVSLDTPRTNLSTYMRSPVSSPIPWKTYEYNQLHSNGYVSVDPKSPTLSRSNRGTDIEKNEVSLSQKTPTASPIPWKLEENNLKVSASITSEFNSISISSNSNVSTLSTTQVTSPLISRNNYSESKPMVLKTSIKNHQATATSSLSSSSRTPIPSPIPWTTDNDGYSLNNSSVSTNSSIINKTVRLSPVPFDLMKETKSLKTPIPSPIPWTTNDKYCGQRTSVSNSNINGTEDRRKIFSNKSSAASPIPWKEELNLLNTNGLSSDVLTKPIRSTTESPIPWISEYNLPKNPTGKEYSKTEDSNKNISSVTETSKSKQSSLTSMARSVHKNHQSNNQIKQKLSLNNQESKALETENSISAQLESPRINISNKHENLMTTENNNINISTATSSVSPILWMNEVNQTNSHTVSQVNELTAIKHKAYPTSPVPTSLRSPPASPIPWIPNQLPSNSSTLKPILKKINVTATYRSPPTSPLPWAGEAQSRSPIPWSPVPQPKSFSNDNSGIEPKFSKSYNLVSEYNNLVKSKNNETFSMSSISTASNQTDLKMTSEISSKEVKSTIQRNSACPNTKISWQASQSSDVSSPLPWEPNSRVSSPTLLKRETNSHSTCLTSNQDTRQYSSPLPWMSYPRSPLLSRSPVPWSSPDSTNSTTQTRPVKSPLPWTFNKIKVENIPDVPLDQILSLSTSSYTPLSQSLKPVESSDISLNKPVKRNTSVRTSGSPYISKELRDGKTSSTSSGFNKTPGSTELPSSQNTSIISLNPASSNNFGSDDSCSVIWSHTPSYSVNNKSNDNTRPKSSMEENSTTKNPESRPSRNTTYFAGQSEESTQHNVRPISPLYQQEINRLNTQSPVHFDMYQNHHPVKSDFYTSENKDKHTSDISIKDSKDTSKNLDEKNKSMPIIITRPGPERPITRIIFKTKQVLSPPREKSSSEVRNVPINFNIESKNKKTTTKNSPPTRSKSSRTFEPVKNQLIRRTKSVLPEIDRSEKEKEESNKKKLRFRRWDFEGRKIKEKRLNSWKFEWAEIDKRHFRGGTKTEEKNVHILTFETKLIEYV